ncbi:MAG TPA: hypothetical protein VGR37_22640 [Longimicrobiaceae bacterium]|nr:hypothetical protein [Longimicrobiaceae bacterium]
MGGGTRTDDLSPEEKLQMLELLVGALPEGRREEARRVALEHLRAAFADHGLPVPEWIRMGQERCGRPE